MPEYEYRCRDCEQVLSIQCSMNESPDEAIGNCNHCSSKNLARIWGASFVSAKGQASGTAQSGMCASNPSQPKSCCPCS